MVLRNYLIAITIALLSIAIAGKQAYAASQENGAEQIILTPQLVERAITCHVKFSQLIKKPELVGKVDDSIGLVDKIAALVDVPTVKGEITQILKQQGFSNFAEWSKASYSISLAYGYIDEGMQDSPDFEKERKQTLDSVGNDKTLTPEQRGAAIKEVEEQFNLLQSLAPLPGNVAIVRPFAARLKPLYGGGDG